MTLSDVGANPLVVLRSKAIRNQPSGMLHMKVIISSYSSKSNRGKRKRRSRIYRTPPITMKL